MNGVRIATDRPTFYTRSRSSILLCCLQLIPSHEPTCSSFHTLACCTYGARRMQRFSPDRRPWRHERGRGSRLTGQLTPRSRSSILLCCLLLRCSGMQRSLSAIRQRSCSWCRWRRPARSQAEEVCRGGGTGGEGEGEGEGAGAGAGEGEGAGAVRARGEGAGAVGVRVRGAVWLRGYPAPWLLSRDRAVVGVCVRWPPLCSAADGAEASAAASATVATLTPLAGAVVQKRPKAGASCPHCVAAAVVAKRQLVGGPMRIASPGLDNNAVRWRWLVQHRPDGVSADNELPAWSWRCPRERHGRPQPRRRPCERHASAGHACRATRPAQTAGVPRAPCGG